MTRLMVAAMVVIGLWTTRTEAADLPTFGSIENNGIKNGQRLFTVKKTTGEKRKTEQLLQDLTKADGSQLNGEAGSHSSGNSWVGIEKTGDGLSLRSIQLRSHIPGSTYMYLLEFGAKPTAFELERIGTALEKFHQVGRLTAKGLAKIDPKKPTTITLIVSLND